MKVAAHVKSRTEGKECIKIHIAWFGLYVLFDVFGHSPDHAAQPNIYHPGSSYSLLATRRLSHHLHSLCLC